MLLSCTDPDPDQPPPLLRILSSRLFSMQGIHTFLATNFSSTSKYCLYSMSKCVCICWLLQCKSAVLYSLALICSITLGSISISSGQTVWCHHVSLLLSCSWGLVFLLCLTEILILHMCVGAEQGRSALLHCPGLTGDMIIPVEVHDNIQHICFMLIEVDT